MMKDLLVNLQLIRYSKSFKINLNTSYLKVKFATDLQYLIEVQGIYQN